LAAVAWLWLACPTFAASPQPPADPQSLPTIPGAAASDATKPQPGQLPPGQPPGAPRPKKGQAASTLPPGPWRFFPLGAAWLLDLGAAPSAPPAFEHAVGFVALQSGQLVSVDLVTGLTGWTRPASTRTALVADAGRLFLVGDGELEAIDQKDGKSLWRVPLPGKVVRRPAAKGGWVIVGLDSGDVTALRADDGKTVWSAPAGGPLTLEPRIEGDRVYLASPTRGLLACDVVTGRVLWERQVDGAITAVTAGPGAVYAGTAGRWFYALDDGSGKVSWHWRVAGEPIGIALEDRVVVTLMLDHTMRAFKTGNGAQAWRETLLYRPFAGPLSAPGQWLVAGHGAMVRAYNKTDGSRGGAFTLPSTPSPDGGPEQIETLVAAPYVRVTDSVFDDLLVLITQRGIMHAARRQLMPAATPLTTMPGVPFPAPAPPPAVTTTATSPTPP
jgi:serine/threonine-protein kinase